MIVTCFCIAKCYPMTMKLSRIKVDLSSFNLIGHNGLLDLCTGRYEFLKLCPVSGMKSGTSCIWRNSGNDMAMMVIIEYFYMKVY